ncbi:MAG: 50S ribosomal protein L4 [Candidatus Sumerlaeaceae bacterium]
MATLTVRDAKGADAGTVDVSDAIFSVEPNKNAVRQALIAYEANQRQGTHSTKTRAFVRGGGRKPWKQKGTGRARQGSIRSPQWRGGAIIFGPTPRDYRQKVNKKVRRLALNSVLSDLRNENKITVLKAFGFEAPRTKDFISLLGRIGVSEAQRVLVLTTGSDDNVKKSAANIASVLVSDVQNVNVYDLLTCDHLITTPEALKALEKQFGAEEEAA